MGSLERLRHKRPALLAAVAAALVVLAAAALVWSGSSAKTATIIGYVDVDRVASEYLGPALNEPLKKETERLQAELDKELARLDAEFDDKSKGMNESDKADLRERYQQQKQDLFVKYQQQLDQRKQEMINARLPKIREAIGKVGERLGLEVVLDKSQVIWGGRDTTDEVLRELGVKTQANAPSGR